MDNLSITSVSITNFFPKWLDNFFRCAWLIQGQWGTFFMAWNCYTNSLSIKCTYSCRSPKPSPKTMGTTFQVKFFHQGNSFNPAEFSLWCSLFCSPNGIINLKSHQTLQDLLFFPYFTRYDLNLIKNTKTLDVGKQTCKASVSKWPKHASVS